MKKLISAATLLCCLCLSTSVFAKTKYFAHVMFQETPYTKYEGIHEINKDTALQRSHYRFDYNEENQIIKIGSYTGKHASSHLGSFDTYYWMGASLQIEYKNDSEIHYFLGSDGKSIESPYLPHHAVYTLNKQGQRVGLAFFGKDGSKRNNSVGAHRYDWQRLDDGTLVEDRYNTQGEYTPLRYDFDFQQTRFTFDENGWVQFIYNYTPEGEPLNNDSGAGIDRIFYDLAGNFIRWQVYDKDGDPVEGNAPMVHIGEYLYNDMGEKIQVRFFDRYGKPMNSADGLQKALFEYNDKATLKVETHINLLGNVIQKHQRSYTEDGAKIEWDRFFDGDSNPVETPYFGGAAAVNYKYDKSGKMIERLHYNKDLAFFNPFAR